MYKPLYWYHGNVKFPDTEVEKMISDLTKSGDHIRSLMEKSLMETSKLGVREESSIRTY